MRAAIGRILLWFSDPVTEARRQVAEAEVARFDFTRAQPLVNQAAHDLAARVREMEAMLPPSLKSSR